MPNKHPEFWKKVRVTMRERFGITAKTKINGKSGYMLMAYMQSVAFDFNELGEPPKRTLKCNDCDFRTNPTNTEGMKKHKLNRHPSFL